MAGFKVNSLPVNTEQHVINSVFLRHFITFLYCLMQCKVPRLKKVLSKAQTMRRSPVTVPGTDVDAHAESRRPASGTHSHKMRTKRYSLGGASGFSPAVSRHSLVRTRLQKEI